jgi:uncharacterized protein (TIGR03435 family)
MIRAATVLALMGSAAIVAAQAPADQPRFEVASVRPNNSGDTRSMVTWPKGSFSATNMPLRMLIAQAYGVPLQLMRFVIVGGPGDLLESRFDIQARLPETAPEGPHLLMLRSLLAERFNLRAHDESRPTPIYALAVAREDRRLGADLRPSTIDCNAERDRLRGRGERFTPENAPRDSKGRPLCWGSSQFAVPGAQTLTNAGPIADLIRAVQAFVDRPIADATGLSGTLEWQLVFAFGAKANPDLPSLFTALQEQLGLKLEARTGPYEVLVIDSLEQPTPN